MLDNGPKSIAMTHVGYLHVAPRVLTIPVAALPASLVPVGFALLTVAATAGLAWYVLTDAARDGSDAFVNRLVGGAIVCLPIAGVEAFGNAANLQQFMWVTALWIALAPAPTSRLRTWLAIVIVASAALSSPLVLLLVPVFAVRMRELRFVAAAFVAGVTVHVLAMLRSRSERQGIARGDGDVLMSFRDYTKWVIGGTVEPDRTHWTAASVVVVAALVVLLAAAGSAARRPLTLLTLSFVYWYVSTSLGQGVAPRHAVAPAIVVVWVLVEIAPRTFRSPVAFALAVTWMFALGLGGLRTAGPSWIDAVQQVGACDETAEIPLAPNTWGYVRYPCDRL
jgi:hypothetical protein